MKFKIVVPTPFFQINMQCSNRSFYGVRDELWDIGADIDESQEMRQGYVVEKCDYSGDLESIRILNCKETKEYIEIIKNNFSINEKIPKGMDIVFTCI